MGIVLPTQIRKLTKKVKIGNFLIGGGEPILVQSMVKSKNNIFSEIKELEEHGCKLIRVAIRSFSDAKLLKEIKKETKSAIIGDIHFNYKLAIESIKHGADKIRINPGNIGGKERVNEIVQCLKDYNIPMRIGVNSGSLEKKLLEKYGGPTSEALCESLLTWVKIIEDMGVDNLVLSVKSSNVWTTVNSYRKIANEVNYPLHIGVTATCVGIPGIIRSSIGIGSLLCDGIGDTIRISLTGSSLDEVKVGNEILTSLGLNSKPIIISCPTCSRREIEVEKLVEEIMNRINKINKHITIAVMGCIVNGPGEAKEADIGVTGTRDYGVIFKKGKIIKKVKKNEIINALINEISNE